MSPPTERDLTLPSSLLPALAPPPRGGASIGVQRRSAAAQPTQHLPASPHRVEGSRLAGATVSSTPPANVIRNVAPTWATTRAGSNDSSPLIFDFMLLYDICVTTGHAARVTVSHIMGFQDVTLFCRFPTPVTTATALKRCRHRKQCPSVIAAACPPPPPSQGGRSSFSVPGSPRTRANGGSCNIVFLFKDNKNIKEKLS
jgi:hypothetical protein